MRLQQKPLGFIINFLLGAAWAFVLIGAATSFFAFSSSNIFYALISAAVGTLPGLIAVLLLEYIITSKEKHEELKKQTKLLEELVKQKNA